MREVTERVEASGGYWTLLAILLVLVVTTFQGCSSKDPIRVGFVGGTSGRVADLGISGRDAAQLTVEACNRSGGIDGRPVRLIVKDDRQDPATARRAVQELIDAGVVAMIGPMTSDMAVAVTPLLNAARLVTVSPTATTEALSGKDDYFFRVTSTTLDYATKSARYQIDRAGARRIAAVYDRGNRSFCENWLENFEGVFTAAGGALVATINFKSDEPPTFLEIAHKLLTSRPDCVMIIANSMDSALLCHQIRKIDEQMPIMLADWGGTERLLELGGKSVEGVTVVQTFDRNSQAPSYQSFREAYIERYQREPGFPGVHTHDAVQVVLATLRRQKRGEGFKKALLAIEQFDGLQGNFSLDEFGDTKRGYETISVVRNNRFVVLE